jgi:hypothetical protein
MYQKLLISGLRRNIFPLRMKRKMRERKSGENEEGITTSFKIEIRPLESNRRALKTKARSAKN